jgi:hypothetical protein
MLRDVVDGVAPDDRAAVTTLARIRSYAEALPPSTSRA